MPKQTPLLIKPSLAEISLQAAKIGLPPREAEKFFHYYTSNGWRAGRNPMRNWLSALQHWKLVWEERPGNHAVKVKTIMQKDLDAMDRQERKQR